MPRTSDLERRLRAYVAHGSGIDRRLVIPGNDSGSVPPGLFASVTLIHDSTEGQPSETLRGERVDLSITHRAAYSIQFYQKGAEETARAFVAWLDTPLAKLEEDRSLPEFGGARFRVVNPLTIRDLSRVIPDDSFEERIGIDLEIAYIQPASQDVGRVERVPVEINGDVFEVDAES